jgi:hypothetical protein
MAKKTRIDRRGTIKPLVKSFPPAGRVNWRKFKTIGMYLNRRQWEREFGVVSISVSSGEEIEMEHLSDYFLVTEASSPSAPTYIITE